MTYRCLHCGRPNDEGIDPSNPEICSGGPYCEVWCDAIASRDWDIRMGVAIRELLGGSRGAPDLERLADALDNDRYCEPPLLYRRIAQVLRDDEELRAQGRPGPVGRILTFCAQTDSVAELVRLARLGDVVRRWTDAIRYDHGELITVATLAQDADRHLLMEHEERIVGKLLEAIAAELRKEVPRGE